MNWYDFRRLYNGRCYRHRYEIKEGGLYKVAFRILDMNSDKGEKDVMKMEVQTVLLQQPDYHHGFYPKLRANIDTNTVYVRNPNSADDIIKRFWAEITEEEYMRRVEEVCGSARIVAKDILFMELKDARKRWQGKCFTNGSCYFRVLKIECKVFDSGDNFRSISIVTNWEYLGIGADEYAPVTWYLEEFWLRRKNFERCTRDEFNKSLVGKTELPEIIRDLLWNLKKRGRNGKESTICVLFVPYM